MLWHQWRRFRILPNNGTCFYYLFHCLVSDQIDFFILFTTSFVWLTPSSDLSDNEEPPPFPMSCEKSIDQANNRLYVRQRAHSSCWLIRQTARAPAGYIRASGPSSAVFFLINVSARDVTPFRTSMVDHIVSPIIAATELRHQIGAARLCP